MANLYKRYRSDLTAATPTTLIQVPEASVMIIRSIWFCNTGGAASTIKVSFSPAGSGNQPLVNGYSLASNDYYDVIGTKPTGPLVLEGLDQLRVESSGNGVSAVVSALIVDRT
jgi:hypothetical protein